MLWVWRAWTFEALFLQVKGSEDTSGGCGSKWVSMGATEEPLRRHTWASRGIFHATMFHRGWKMYDLLVGMDAPMECLKLRHVTQT